MGEILVARPCLARGVRLRGDPVTREAALLYPEGVLLLNGTAAAVVELCDGNRTLSEIVAALASRYASRADSLLSDVADYLRELRRRGLVTMADEGRML
jgi:coenzyme PQQ biosynthesis protein PqqD